MPRQMGYPGVHRCPVLIGVDRYWSVLYVACLLSALWILWQIPRLNFLALSWCGKPNAIDLQLGIGYDFHLFLASHWWMVDGLWWFMMVAGSGFELPQMFPDRCRDPCGGVASPKFGAARPRGRRETSKPRWGAVKRVKRVTRMRHDVEFAASQLHSFTDKLSCARPSITRRSWYLSWYLSWFSVAPGAKASALLPASSAEHLGR